MTKLRRSTRCSLRDAILEILSQGDCTIKELFLEIRKKKIGSGHMSTAKIASYISHNMKNVKMREGDYPRKYGIVASS